ncbi:MAG: hypothetical protein JEZ09_10435 [Salinivirgaceae bacterium]|nr:hypothetical protein [Salinivirgaceae bacterium]
MKLKNLSILPVFVISMLLVPFSSVGQKKQIPVDETIKWNQKTSKTETIEFEVKKGVEELEMNFEGNISQGSLKLTLRNPKGYKASGFSLLSSGSKHSPSSRESISAKADKELSEERERAEKSKSSSYSSSSSSSSKSSSSASSSSSSTSVSYDSDSDTGVSIDVNVTKDNGDEKKTNIKRRDKSVVKTESNEEGARGVMKKTIKKPESGIWIVSIELENVKGELSAKIAEK